LQRIATIVQRQNMSWFDFESCVDLPNGGLGVPAMHENDAEQMQAVEMRGLCCENLPIYFFRISQSTGLMERHSLRKCRGRGRGAGCLPRGEEIARLLVHDCRLDDSSTGGVNARHLPDGFPGLNLERAESLSLRCESTVSYGVVAVN
jgi:hypothetical protein